MKLADLKPAPYNPRSIGDAALSGLSASLGEFGDISGFVFNSNLGYMVCGHQRLAALKDRFGARVSVGTGDSGVCVIVARDGDDHGHEFPIRIVDWDEKRSKAANIAANSAHLAGEWTDGLGPLLDELQADLPELCESLRFDLLRDGTVPLLTQDEIPEPPGDPVTQLGDLWTLGEHKVLCADARKAHHLFKSDPIGTVITDPPYGVGYTGKTKRALTIKNDDSAVEELLFEVLGPAKASCTKGANWYVFAPPGPQFYAFASVLRNLELWRQTLVWVKDSMVLGHSDYHYRHECIVYGWVQGARHTSPATRVETTVWEFDRPKASRDHPTTKPLALIAKCLANSKGLVHDPFLGGGSTLIAAEQMKRRCIGIELDPRYVDVTLARWKALTNECPRRESDGRHF